MKKDCDSIVGKKDVVSLKHVFQGVDWCDEDSVWDLAIELERWSVVLRGYILNRDV